VWNGGQAVSAHFDLDGEHLWFGSYEGGATLRKVAIKTKNQETVSIPALSKDAVSYIAQNPANAGQYAIATFNRNVYLSPDGGKSWNQIAEQGKTR
jgi:hypothetical protein